MPTNFPPRYRSSTPISSKAAVSVAFLPTPKVDIQDIGFSVVTEPDIFVAQLGNLLADVQNLCIDLLCLR
jgi:hypothetical protein